MPARGLRQNFAGSVGDQRNGGAVARVLSSARGSRRRNLIRGERFVLVNRAFEAMLKVPRSEVLGKTVFEIYRSKDAERIDASDNEALANEFGAHSTDYEIEMPHGDSRILTTNGIVARDSQGVARHLIVVMDDVTERKKSDRRIAFIPGATLLASPCFKSVKAVPH